MIQQVQPAEIQGCFNECLIHINLDFVSVMVSRNWADDGINSPEKSRD